MLLIGMGIGIMNFAQADSITLVGTSGSPVLDASQITGPNAYLFQFTAASLGLTTGETISDVQLVFTDVELTSSDAKNTVSADVIDANIAPPKGNAYTDNDVAGDYFKTPGDAFTTAHPSVTVNNLGTENFNAPTPIYGTGKYKYTIIGYNYDTESWSYNLNSTELNNDLNALLGFDIGIDPDCIYDVGSIVLKYDITAPKTVPAPDVTTTAGLLGMSLMGLLFLRRKLAFN